MPHEPLNMKTRVHAVWLLVAVALGVLLAQALPNLHLGRSDSETHDHGAHTQAQLWTCGMHPQVIQEEPGQCPICGMDLTPMRSDEAPGPVAKTEAEARAGWTCPDHAMINESEPGQCPIDGQDLVEPVDSPKSAAPLKSPVSSKSSGPTVTIDPGVVQNMNVRTEVVGLRSLSQPIRTVGYLEYDQQRMVTVTTKYSGWVEKVYVNYVGEKVRRGQPLFEIYSPELVQTERELLSALAFAEEMSEAPEDASRRARAMVEAARVRLGYWDISAQQIARLEETGEVFRTLKVTAPANGLVMKRMPGLEGMAVNPGMEIFHIADLSSLWLSVELFEDQLAWVREGTTAEISLSYFPGESFLGRVRFLEPELSDATRTIKAKIELANPDGRLRKGMFATVVLQPTAVEKAVAVPSQAVIRTGRRNMVLVAEGGGRFTPREVILGHEAQGFVEIRQGLDAGVEVVTSAQFLLDSESKLKAAVQAMIAERAGSRAQ